MSPMRWRESHERDPGTPPAGHPRARLGRAGRSGHAVRAGHRAAAGAPPASCARPRWSPVAASVALAVLVVALTTAGGDQGARAFASISAAARHAADTRERRHAARALAPGRRVPDWSREFGWMAEGGRIGHDRRPPGGDRLLHAPRPPDRLHRGRRRAARAARGEPRTRRVGGVELIQFRDGPRDVVMFERGGRTCVLAGDVLSAETLVELASWRGRGAVEF